MDKWISVKDRLPEVYDGVLVTDGEIVTAAERHDFFDSGIGWTGHRFGGHEWQWDFDDSFITHWMPLPEPPKKRENNDHN